MSVKFDINLPWEECTGCYSCMNICPVNAISLPPDDLGYIHAVIDKEKCIKCKLCEKTCPVYNEVLKNNSIKVYAGVTKNKEINRDAASGGFLTELSDLIISLHGVVYGCAEINFQDFRHIRIDKTDDQYKIRNSKYIQSEINLILKEVKRDLELNRLVLFTGTGCQIAGLYNFLKKEYSNLITVDVLCHGVPSKKMLLDQVLSKKKLRKIPYNELYIKFRWKEVNQDGLTLIKYGMQYIRKRDTFEEVLLEENDIINSFMKCFHNGVILRESCLSCKYAGNQRVADITAGDFWGLGSKKLPSSLNALNGVSLILINTQKGYSYFKMIENRFIIHEHTFDEAKLFNTSLRRPSNAPFYRAKFLQIAKTKGIVKAARKVDHYHNLETNKVIQFFKKNHITNLVYRIIKKFLKKIGYLK